MPHSDNRLHRIATTMLPFHPTLLVVLVSVHACFSTPGEEVASNMAPPEATDFNRTVYAACKMRPNTKLGEGLPKVYGQVLFKQEYPEGTLKVRFLLHGFSSQSDGQSRAIHIHQYGDFSEGCDSTGGHYNPYKVLHPNHPGDFGNFVASQGRIHKLTESEATLFGGLSVLGRAVVVHEKVDDLGQGGDSGSLLHGNAGQRLACCTIGMSRPKLWDKAHRRQQSRG
ncbi:extracellular superoxide dismutase [Cu-Zn] isoform X1 [Esox lucius]|uniref:Superoxide dismutase [Cu-Zn] n=1 Tax=Esox lucius TaxID=8010 RepID=A0AAY5KLK6_ESOLU|nr:extracellular superoxide dismutase [Cu-Zn] isoform X1 [Esox lucius]